MSDPTFTGRTDIWKFVVTQIMQRPITGYGFATFWGTMGCSTAWRQTKNGSTAPATLITAIWILPSPSAFQA